MASYLIPEPTINNVASSGFKGILLYKESAYNRAYYALSKDNAVTWWAIGMIAKIGAYDFPVIVSDNVNNAFSVCEQGGGISGNVEITYNGKTYYVNYNGQYATDTVGGNKLQNNIIPYCATAFGRGDFKGAGIKLLELYTSAGGSFPGEEIKSAFEPVEYETIGWKNDGPPDISAENLEKMDETIGKLCTNLNIAHEEFEADIQELAETIGAITTTQF